MSKVKPVSRVVTWACDNPLDPPLDKLDSEGELFLVDGELIRMRLE